jgi:hypothetical protein
MAVAFCGNCGARNPSGAPFCGSCGARLAGAPVAVPVAAAAAPAAAAPYPYAYPPVGYQQRAQAIPQKTNLGLWLLAGGGIAFFVVCLAVIAVLVAPRATGTDCRPHCPPPTKPPLGNPHTYTSSAYGYSLDYFDGDTLSHVAQISQQDATGIAWTVNLPNTKYFSAGQYPLVFAGQPAKGRTSQQVVEDVHSASFAQATFVYTIPGAEMGYNAGYGNVYDIAINTANGQSVHGRLIVIAAVKKNVAVTLVSIGPYVKSTPDVDDHPNPSDSVMPELFDAIVDTVRFPGDPVR